MVAKNGEKSQSLFEQYISSLSVERMHELFHAHPFCISMTVDEYNRYQYFYTLCEISKYQNDGLLGLQIEKIFRENFYDIYKIVRRHKEFNIMDYSFLLKECNGLTLIRKLSFSNKAVAMIFFILNKWGIVDEKAYEFCKSLYDIIIEDKIKATMIVREAIDDRDELIADVRKRVLNMFQVEKTEMAFDRIFSMYTVNFEMLYEDCGDTRDIYSAMVSIERILWEQFQNTDGIIDFLSYNCALLLSSIEKYMQFLNDGEIYLGQYVNKKLEREIQILEKQNENINEQFNKLVKLKSIELKDVLDELEEKEKKIKSIEEEVAKQKQLLKETTALRNYVYQFIENNQESYTVSTLADWNEINQLRGVIIGGNDTWQKRLKEKMPDWKFISSSINRIDKGMIANCEYVFVNTSFIGHSMYYGIVSIVQTDNKMNFGFINSMNLERVYNEIVIQVRK